MHTVLVWILLNALSGRTASPYYFANQADCLRAGMQREQVVERHVHYTCVQERIADLYTPPQPMTPTHRAMRNYQSEQDQIDRILSNPPHWQPSQP